MNLGGILENVRSVERSIKILKAIGSSDCGLTVSEISEKVALHSTTVIRLLATLLSENFVQRDSRTLAYSFGEGLVGFFKKSSPREDLKKIAYPKMQELVRQTSETVALFVVSGTKRVCIEKIEGLHPIRWHIDVGDSAPLGISSSGKLLLANAPASLINTVLKKKLTLIDGTLVDSEKLLNELQTIRKQGYACSFSENSFDGAGISVAIRNQYKEVVGSLTILGPISRIKIDNLKTYKNILLTTAQNVSSELGFVD